jgi:hypothetical protein
MPAGQRWSFVAERAKLSQSLSAADIQRLAQVCQAHVSAFCRYTPKPYNGEALLLVASESGDADLDQWHALCPEPPQPPFRGTITVYCESRMLGRWLNISLEPLDTHQQGRATMTRTWQNLIWAARWLGRRVGVYTWKMYVSEIDLHNPIPEVQLPINFEFGIASTDDLRSIEHRLDGAPEAFFDGDREFFLAAVKRGNTCFVAKATARSPDIRGSVSGMFPCTSAPPPDTRQTPPTRSTLWCFPSSEDRRCSRPSRTRYTPTSRTRAFGMCATSFSLITFPPSKPSRMRARESTPDVHEAALL